MNEEKKNSILIIDDENANLKNLTGILGGEYKIYTETSGLNAVEKAKNLKPDLILLDIIMPDMNGYETLKEIKKCEEIRNIPVIFITSLNTLEDEEKGLDLDAADYIHKPFTDKIVMLRVRNQINIINQIRELVEIHQKNENMAEAAKHAKPASLENLNLEKQKPVNAGSSIKKVKPDTPHKKSASHGKNKKSADDISGFIENVRRISDIDTEIGLARSSGKEEVFQKILSIFQKNIEPECGNITAFFYTGDIKNFTNSVHALKTMLATIGAMKLSKAAFELEIASKKQDIDDCTQQFHKFKKNLLSLDKKLSAILPDV